MMPLYTLEYRAPKHKSWYALSASARAPFTTKELDGYKQMLAERTTQLRGVAVFAHQIQVRMLTDGKVARIENEG